MRALAVRLTDVYCHWARALTDNVLMIETDIGIRSLSMGQLLFELLLAAVAQEFRGSEAPIQAVHQLRRELVGFARAEDTASQRSKSPK